MSIVIFRLQKPGFNRHSTVPRHFKLALLTTVWFLTVGLGLQGLLAYKATPGSAGLTPAHWPDNQLLSPAHGKPLLIMFVHPRCPCSRASIGELELLAAQAQGDVQIAVAFFQPDSAAVEWTESATVKKARAIPGVRIISDTEGKLAQRFGAETSGFTVLYAANGDLLFQGGITGSRGHMGDNAAFDAALKLCHNPIKNSSVQTKVFGCRLFDQCFNQQPTLSK